MGGIQLIDILGMIGCICLYIYENSSLGHNQITWYLIVHVTWALNFITIGYHVGVTFGSLTLSHLDMDVVWSNYSDLTRPHCEITTYKLFFLKWVRCGVRNLLSHIVIPVYFGDVSHTVWRDTQRWKTSRTLTIASLFFTEHFAALRKYILP